MTESQPQPQPSRGMLLFNWFSENILQILMVLLLAAAVALLLGFSPQVPRWALIIGLSFIAFLLPGMYVGSAVSDQFAPDYVYLVDVSEDLTDGRLIELLPADLADLEVTDGSLHQASPNLYWCRNLDLENGTVEGVWLGTLSDQELINSLQKVHECRGMLLEDSRKLFAIESNMWSVVYRATKDAVGSVVNTFETSTLPDEGDGVDAAVDDALEDFGLLDRLQGDDDLGDDLVDDLVDDLGDDLGDETLPRPATDD